MTRTPSIGSSFGVGLVVFCLCLPVVSQGQLAADASGSDTNAPAPYTPSPDVAAGGVEVQADRLEYEADRKLLRGTGHVVVHYGRDILQADYIEVYTDTQDSYARGNVLLDRDGEVWSGDELKYNFRTRTGDFGTFTGYAEPFYITAEESKKTDANTFLLHDAVITTCEGDRPEYKIKAKRATVTEGEDGSQKLRANNVFFYLAGLPFFFVPYFKKDLSGDSSNLDVVPGYGSEMGAYLLTAYNYPITARVRGVTHLDYRTKRGLAGGQDFLWEDPAQGWNGSFRAYYLQDDEPFEDEEEEMELGDLVEEERYRLQLKHTHRLTDRDTFITELNYLSDPDIIEDFFDDEFRGNAQPESRATLTHRERAFTAGLEVNRTLNDFYNNLNRLPEGFFTWNRSELGESGFFFESENRGGLYERMFAEQEDEEDYDAVRIDSENTILYPMRLGGFLNLIPQGTYRGTYYSETRTQVPVIETSTTTNETVDTVTGLTNTTVSTLTETNLVDEVDGADIRNAFTFALESSFKAFKVLSDEPNVFGDGIRHVAEPFTIYTYRPEPNLVREDLPQFDSVDRIGERHDIRLGMRNKLQTRIDGSPHDLIDAEIFNDYDLDASGDEEPFGPFGFDVELRPAGWLSVDLDGSYDWADEGILEDFNAQIGLLASDESSLSVEYRFRDERRNLVAVESILWPESNWSLFGYWRYEVDDGELEEQSYSLVHKTSCLGLGIGVKEIDEDITVWGQIWLLAFPESQIDLGR